MHENWWRNRRLVILALPNYFIAYDGQRKWCTSLCSIEQKWEEPRRTVWAFFFLCMAQACWYFEGWTVGQTSGSITFPPPHYISTRANIWVGEGTDNSIMSSLSIHGSSHRTVLAHDLGIDRMRLQTSWGIEIRSGYKHGVVLLSENNSSWKSLLV